MRAQAKNHSQTIWKIAGYEQSEGNEHHPGRWFDLRVAAETAEQAMAAVQIKYAPLGARIDSVRRGRDLAMAVIRDEG